MKEHYDEDMLTRYADDSSSVADAVDVEAHLEECSSCRASVEFYRSFTRHLRSPETWQALSSEEPSVEALVRFSTELDDERLAAAAWISRLQDGVALETILAERALRTAGGVETLCDVSTDVRDRDPAGALVLTDAAVAIANRLSAYPVTLLAILRGTAWRQRATALRYLGRFPEALESLDRAEAALDESMATAFDLARVMYVRATVLFEMSRHEEALVLARESAARLEEFGDERRVLHARMLVASLYSDAGEYAMARDIFERLIPTAQRIGDRVALGLLSNNLGSVAQEVGDYAAASSWLSRALAVYDELGMDVERIRTHWNVASVFLAMGSIEEGLERLHAVAQEYEAIGSRSDAAAVLLDAVEVLFEQGRLAESALLGQSLVERFTSAGMMPSALAALQYLNDALASRNMTRDTIAHVRSQLRDGQRMRSFVSF
jgi:tetratricopeptide (TPR) repeat protein